MQLKPSPTLSLHLPSTWKRTGAMMMDGFIIMPFYGVGMWLGGTTIADGKMFFPWVPYIGFALLIYAYYVLGLKFLGGSPGKKLLGLYVVDLHTGKPELSWGTSFLRPTADLLFGLTLSLAPRALALLRLDRKQLSDLIASTQVMQDEPRPKPPKRRWIIGTLLILYFGLSMLLNLSAIKGNITFDAKGIYSNLTPAKPAE